MEAFAGWSMPIQYELGILAEHRHTRTAAGLFDVSHMGQILVRARSGDVRDAASRSSRWCPRTCYRCVLAASATVFSRREAAASATI